MSLSLTLSMALFACAGLTPSAEKEVTPSMSQSIPPQAVAPAAPAVRPPLRRVMALTATAVNNYGGPDAPANITSWLEQHPQTPTEIRHALLNREIWIGMSQEEVRLLVGEPSQKDAAPDEAGETHWVYAAEGWVMTFRGDWLVSLMEQ